MVGSVYENGFKWCSGCTKFVETGKIRCPKCNTRLRGGPRSNRLKKDSPRID